MKIAIEGCAHGELEKIYETIAYLEEQAKVKVDLLLCCGDFQASRNSGDLECMAVPPKYRNICTFYKYYSGEKIAPMLTIVIGGNHEASNHMQELPYGGWLAPNIYYLGYAGVVKVADIRIAGLSGIFKFRDYQKGRFEIAPYSEDTKRSCYHVRALDVFRLKQLTRPIDVMLSHDWPEGVYNHGNVNALLRKKPFFKDEVENNKLGSPVCAELLGQLQPTHWFSAHLHVKFSALVKHENGGETKFLALDKCLPRRQFLQVLDVPHSGPIELKYDDEWCAILSSTDHLTSVRPSSSYMPGPGHNQRWDFKPSAEEREKIKQRLGEDMKVPLNFEVTAPAYNPKAPRQPPWCAINPQTTEFCQKLGIDDPLELLLQATPSLNTRNDPSANNYSSFLQSDGDSFEFSTPLRHRPPPSFPTPKNDSSNNSFSPRTPLHLPGPKNETPDSTDLSAYESSLGSHSSLFSPRKSMNLPPPKGVESPSVLSDSQISGVESVDVDEGVVSSTSQKEDSSVNEPAVSFSIDTEPTPVEADVLSSPSGPKKFKRRNVAIYSITGEEDM